MKLNLDDLIYDRCDVKLNDSPNATYRMEKVIEEVFKEIDVKMHKVSTNYVFSRIIKTKRLGTILVWDSVYWEIFQEYFIGILALNESKKTLKGDMEILQIQEEYKKFITGCFSYFLALKINDSKLGLVFAEYYRECRESEQKFLIGISFQEMQEYLEICQLYIAIHEHLHYSYKQNIDKKKEDVDNLIILLENAKKLIETMQEDVVHRYYLQRKEDLLESFDKCYEDKKMQEEMLCDTYAFNECLFFCKNLWAEKYTTKKIVSKCFEAINLLKYFNSNLIILDMVWNTGNSYLSQTEEKNIQMKSNQRNYITEIIQCIQLSAQELGDYLDINYAEITGFENDYELEEIVYENFLNDNIRVYWIREAKKKVIDQMEAKRKKYNILKWKVRGNEN